MTNYRNQNACVNCKFVLDISAEGESVFVCNKPPHQRPKIQDYHGQIKNMGEFWVDVEEWEHKYNVAPNGICHDYELSE